MKKTAFLAPVGGLGLGVPAWMMGLVPAEVLAVLGVAIVLVALLIVFGRAVVTEVIRVRSSLADPTTAHLIDMRHPGPLPKGKTLDQGEVEVKVKVKANKKSSKDKKKSETGRKNRHSGRPA